MINLEKEIREQPKVLASIKEKNISAIRAAVAAAKSAGITNICFAARGTSDHASIFAQYLFGIYAGVPCSLATPSVVSQYGTKLNFANTLVIGVSQSGRAADVLAVVENANECGLPTVAVTNNEDSPLAKTAAFHLYCNAGPEVSIAATKTFTAQMMLLALLCAEWAKSEELFALLDRVPAAAERLLSYMPQEIASGIGAFTSAENAILLGRGTSYPIALEGAIKILETNRMYVKGYAISDFHHGPMAQVKRGDAVIVLAPESVLINDAVEITAKLDKVGARTVIISDSEKMLAGREFALRIPALGSDSVSPFMLAITVQLIALELCLAKGIDPDKSDVLNKVTITK
jgi:glucosamine--fructose-6-phosphate aminotransferase (isomerizing)